MKVNVRLHGDMEKAYGKDVAYDVETYIELLSAMSATLKGFDEKFAGSKYLMMCNGDPVSEEEKRMPPASGEVHILAVPEGKDIFAAIMVVLEYLGTMYIEIGMSQFVAGVMAVVTVAAIGYAALNGISKMLSPDPGALGNDGFDDEANTYFDGPVNTTKQGNPVPIFYGGPMLVGSQVISSVTAIDDDSTAVLSGISVPVTNLAPADISTATISQITLLVSYYAGWRDFDSGYESFQLITTGLTVAVNLIQGESTKDTSITIDVFSVSIGDTVSAGTLIASYNPTVGSAVVPIIPEMLNVSTFRGYIKIGTKISKLSTKSVYQRVYGTRWTGGYKRYQSYLRNVSISNLTGFGDGLLDVSSVQNTVVF